MLSLGVMAIVVHQKWQVVGMSPGINLFKKINKWKKIEAGGKATCHDLSQTPQEVRALCTAYDIFNQLH